MSNEKSIEVKDLNDIDFVDKSDISEPLAEVGDVSADELAGLASKYMSESMRRFLEKVSI